MNSEKGLTLIELVMVIIIIGILSGVAMKSMNSAITTGRVEATKKELNAIAEAIVGNPDLVSNGSRIDFGYVGDVGALPGNLDALVTNPGYATWNGPYLSSNFLQSPDDYKTDAWGVLYDYDGGVVVTSTGSGGPMTRRFGNTATDFTANQIEGTVLDGEGVPPGVYGDDVTIAMTYPDGTGATTDTVVNPSANGYFSFSGIPVGNHKLTTVYSDTQDTVISFVTVTPKSSPVCNIRFGSALWAAGNSSSGNGLQYVDGTASVYGSSGQHIRFNIYNNTGNNITIDWIEATYTHTPEAFYQRVRWGTTTVANSNNPRFASGDRADFSSPRTINNETTVTLRWERFRDTQSGGGSWVHMAGTTMTVVFSDGSEMDITF